MKNFVKKITSLLLSSAVLCGTILFSGCETNTSDNSSNKIIPLNSSSSAKSEVSSASGATSTGNTDPTPVNAASSSTQTEVSEPEQPNPPEQSEQTDQPVQPDPPEQSTATSPTTPPTFDVPNKEPLPLPSSDGVRIRSLSEALENFSEIESAVPEGSPEEIVKTLLERNILCFATLQVKCWTYDESKYAWNYEFVTGSAPIQSEYLTSTQQIDDLFYGTYTNSKANYLIHYDNGWDTDDAFTSDNGSLRVDFSQLLKAGEDSFKTATYAAVISASDDEIVFGRYYEQNPVKGAPEPNNWFFKAVNYGGEWRLEEYITDAPAYRQPYGNLIQTNRIGAPDILKIASQEVGNFNGEPYWSWYGFDYRIEWCAAFVSWCYCKAGKDEPYFIDCNGGGISWFKSHGQWADADYRDIAPGDSIFFDWDLNGLANHVGLVIGTDGKKVYTIEGNRSNACRTLAYDLDDPHIFGYGLMNWD